MGIQLFMVFFQTFRVCKLCVRPTAVRACARSSIECIPEGHVFRFVCTTLFSMQPREHRSRFGERPRDSAEVWRPAADSLAFFKSLIALLSNYHTSTYMNLYALSNGNLMGWRRKKKHLGDRPHSRNE